MSKGQFGQRRRFGRGAPKIVPLLNDGHGCLNSSLPAAPKVAGIGILGSDQLRDTGIERHECYRLFSVGPLAALLALIVREVDTGKLTKQR
jgi:hypothetical protein